MATEFRERALMTEDGYDDDDSGALLLLSRVDDKAEGEVEEAVDAEEKAYTDQTVRESTGTLEALKTRNNLEGMTSDRKQAEGNLEPNEPNPDWHHRLTAATDQFMDYLIQDAGNGEGLTNQERVAHAINCVKLAGNLVNREDGKSTFLSEYMPVREEFMDSFHVAMRTGMRGLAEKVGFTPEEVSNAGFDDLIEEARTTWVEGKEGRFSVEGLSRTMNELEAMDSGVDHMNHLTPEDQQVFHVMVGAARDATEDLRMYVNTGAIYPEHTYELLKESIALRQLVSNHVTGKWNAGD